MMDGQNDKKFSTWNPEAKCMVCTWLKKTKQKKNKKTLKRNPEAKCMVCTWLKKDILIRKYGSFLKNHSSTLGYLLADLNWPMEGSKINLYWDLLAKQKTCCKADIRLMSFWHQPDVSFSLYFDNLMLGWNQVILMIDFYPQTWHQVLKSF